MIRHYFSPFTVGVLLTLCHLPCIWAEGPRITAADVVFHAQGPAGFKLTGTSHNLSLLTDENIFTFSVELSTLKTGIDLRDQHMREKYLQVQLYPKAVLKLPRSEARVPASGEATGYATGNFTLHGVTKPLAFRYSARRDGKDVKAEASFTINIKDYGIEEPSFMGLTVKPEVTVNVNFTVGNI